MGKRVSKYLFFLPFQAISAGSSVFASDDSNTRLSIDTCRCDDGWVTYLVEEEEEVEGEEEEEEEEEEGGGGGEEEEQKDEG